jgi:integrase
MKFILVARVAGDFQNVVFKRDPKTKRDVPVEPVGATSYYVRFTENGKRVRVPLGKDLAKAFTDFQSRQLADGFIAAGREVPKEVTVEKVSSLQQKIDEYIAEIKLAVDRKQKATKSLQAYTNTLKYFALSCKRPNLSSITKDDVLAFPSFLEAEELSQRTIYNNFLNVMIFLKWAGVKHGIVKKEWPEKSERPVEMYSDEELTDLFTAATDEGRLILKSFLYSGVRSGELSNLTYGNINYKSSIWTIKPQNGWNTKNKKAREVPVPLAHSQKIAERMVALKRTKIDLIFPNTKNEPNDHLIRVVKDAAERAGITGRVDDHKFRSTCATLWLRDGYTVEDVRLWLGHSDLKTVQRYLAAMKLHSQETQQKITKTFAAFATVGGD